MTQQPGQCKWVNFLFCILREMRVLIEECDLLVLLFLELIISQQKSTAAACSADLPTSLPRPVQMTSEKKRHIPQRSYLYQLSEHHFARALMKSSMNANLTWLRILRTIISLG